MKQDKLKATARLLEIMDTLREQCPWDRKQTFETLRNNTIEETYELADATLHKDLDGIKEEAGDLLLHVVFYAKLGEEAKLAFEYFPADPSKKAKSREEDEEDGDEEVDALVGAPTKKALPGPRAVPRIGAAACASMPQPSRMWRSSGQQRFDGSKPTQPNPSIQISAQACAASAGPCC